ncbi:MAG TPA: Gfo/Idh/MocA family oxidoreductase [Candidatus Limnocylindrales bacterium]
MERLRVGVIGCGLVAQLMHLHYLRELGDRFEVAALCDLSPGTLAGVADRHRVAARFTDWREMLESVPLDLVMVLTSASHADPAVAALELGCHVFVEKPMALTVADADRMISAAREAGRSLTVGYMKRHDPAFAAAAARLATIGPLRHVGITTLESPIGTYVGHEDLVRVADLPAATLEAGLDERRRLVGQALGRPGDDTNVRAYHDLLLDSAIHELNLLRGLVGDPTDVLSAEFWDDARSMQLVLAYPDDLRVSFSFVWLPDLPEYVQELAFRAAGARLAIRFPSPFLRNAATLIELDESDGDVLRRGEIVAGYDEAFRRELVHLHRTVVDGIAPLVSPESARGDIALAGLIARSWLDRTSLPVAGLDAARPV